MATDTLNEANAKVIIFIRDVNDLPPVFDETSYTAHIFEEEIPIKSILQVSFTSFFLRILKSHSKWGLVRNVKKKFRPKIRQMK